MLKLIKIILALFTIWGAFNTEIVYDNIPLYDSAFTKKYGVVIEQTFEGYELENDYYLIEFTDGNIHEIEGDDLNKNDSVTVWFLGNIPVRMMYDRR